MVPIRTSRLYLVTCALMGALECLMKKVLLRVSYQKINFLKTIRFKRTRWRRAFS